MKKRGFYVIIYSVLKRKRKIIGKWNKYKKKDKVKKDGETVNTQNKTQKAIADLFDTSKQDVSYHLKNIFNTLELEENAVVKKYNTNYYNLDAVISIGFRVNSDKAIQFRRWSINILKEFAKKGYIIDKKRMENGIFFDEDYFESLLDEIREIRLSKIRFYQKITDIYATSIDYDRKSPITIKFFKQVQNKIHYAVSHNTAAEIIYNRADSEKEYMGLTSWKNSPNGKILETDVVIAKNYLSKDEIEGLELIVSSFLDLAESRAKRNIPMAMNDCYAREISEKVKSILKVKQQNSDFIGTFAPYGYLKDPKDKHKLIIDKDSSIIVRKIFDMILLGKSRKEIADFLNNNNVLTSSLRNETYTGTLIQNIKAKPSYKNNKLIDVNKDDWIKTENHHEALISKDKFDEVQQILDRKIKVNKNNEIDLFSGYLKCFRCGGHLIIRKNKNQVYYYCSAYIKDKNCLKYSINKKKLEKLIIKH